MKKLIIKEIKEYSYLFSDGDNEIEMVLEFQGIDYKLQIGDIIYFPKKLVQDKQFYSFGPLGEKYSKQSNIDYKELIKILTPEGDILLQRYYG